jgi:hypothetical protein
MPFKSTKASKLIKKNAPLGAPLAALATLTFIFTLLTLFLLVAHVVLYVYTWSWIQSIRNKGCTCADDWRQTYILGFPPTAFFLAILLPLTGGASPVINLALLAGWIFFIVNALTYVRHLRTTMCTCATEQTKGDEYLQMYAYLPVIGWAMSVVFMLILAFAIALMRR